MLTNINYYMVALVAALGLCWGSFLTVVTWRIDDLKTIFINRSSCTSCNAEIRWYDLIPLVSYGILRGKCRDCHGRISGIYPLVEVLTALVFLAIYIKFGFIWLTILLVAIFSVLIVIFAYDALHFLVIDQAVWLGVGLVVLYQLIVIDWEHWQPTAVSLGWGLLVGFLIPLGLVAISRGKWMGEGDIGLGCLVGLLVGYPSVFLAYFIAFALGSAYGLVAMALKKKSMRDPIPFSPFLVLGAMIAFFVGHAIINWYVHLSLFNI